MAYIIAHGTVNGYCKIPSPQSIGIEQNVLTDIRAQFDNTPTMLQKPVGYLIQMASNGVWISVVKLLFDGERSGGGAGFFAFSAFVSANQYVQGSALRNLLDDLMNTYLSKTSGTSTKNIGVDWSFVNDATAKLNELCISRQKPINTHYLPSDKFAYVGISDNDIDKYLEKPFQPEYGQYKVVFLGTHLLHPSLLPSQTPLSIDLENEEYTIEWHGDNGLWKNLPTTVRKKEIEHGSYTFRKQYYEDQTVFYREGQRDDVNNIIILTIPQLNSIVYKLEVVYEVMGTSPYKPSDSEAERIVPDGVISLSARTLGVQDPRKSDDKKTIEFYGEQVAMTWTLEIETNKNYKSVPMNIRPIDYCNSASAKGQCLVRLEKLKTISVLILKDEVLKTSDLRASVTFYNKTTGQEVYGFYDPQTKYLQFYIPENTQCLDILGVRVKESYKDRWDISQIEPLQTENYFQVRLSRKQEPPKVPSTNRIIHIHVYDEKIGKEGILLVSDNNGRKIQCNLRCTNRTYKEGDIQVLNTVPRSDLTITTMNGEPLHFDTEDADVIIIYDKTIFSRLWDWIRQQWQVLPVIVVVIIAISAVGLRFYYKNFFPQKPKHPTAENGVMLTNNNSGSNSKESSYSNGLPDFCQSRYVDSMYQVQCSKWNQAEIGELMDSINDDLAINLRERDSVAYVRYKQIAWLQVRGKVNKADWNHLADYIKESNCIYEDKWKNYANDSIREFLLGITNAPVAKLDKFTKKINDDSTFADKTFNEVKEIWNNCSSSSQITQSTQGGQQNNNGIKNSNSKKKQGMKSAGDF